MCFDIMNNPSLKEKTLFIILSMSYRWSTLNNFMEIIMNGKGFSWTKRHVSLYLKEYDKVLVLLKPYDTFLVLFFIGILT